VLVRLQQVIFSNTVFGYLCSWQWLVHTRWGRLRSQRSEWRTCAVCEDGSSRSLWRNDFLNTSKLLACLTYAYTRHVLAQLHVFFLPWAHGLQSGLRKTRFYCCFFLKETGFCYFFKKNEKSPFWIVFIASCNITIFTSTH